MIIIFLLHAVNIETSAGVILQFTGDFVLLEMKLNEEKLIVKDLRPVSCKSFRFGCNYELWNCCSPQLALFPAFFFKHHYSRS